MGVLLLRFSIAVFALFPVFVQAGSVSLPIKRTTVGWDYSFDTNYERQDFEQIPLGAHQRRRRVEYTSPIHKPWHQECEIPESRFTSQKTSVNSNTIYHPLFTTTISLGIPPQPFTALIDTTHGASFVPSSSLTTTTTNENPPQNLYSSANSRTSRPDVLPTKHLYTTASTSLHTWGAITFDTLHLDSLQLESHVFQECTTWHADPRTRDDVFSTILGLALGESTFGGEDGDGAWGNFTGRSVWRGFVENEVLDRNVFVLEVPRTDEEEGRLTVGGVPGDLELGGLVEVPLVDVDVVRRGKSLGYPSSMFVGSGWVVALEDLVIVGVGVKKEESVGKRGGEKMRTGVLRGKFAAVVSSSHPYITLPTSAAREINEALGLSGLHDWIDCGSRDMLPELRFSFGPKGRSVTLSAWEYLVEVWDDLHGKRKCVSAFQESDELEEDEEDGIVVLGTPFLAGVSAVFDAGGQGDDGRMWFGERRVDRRE